MTLNSRGPDELGAMESDGKTFEELKPLLEQAIA